ncbi:hypothetical protein LOTGIDRAFT_233214 [Lottia gigantea]|uniref:Fe2OG dioxygenase domain-containing protein n=1 Tax=Lottia gigantea TaxID=225164 RepID=V4AAN4_LOTGI|nr:hypothetical protein LOTGIDRAFT_233214 [Lottia gigantea]ESO92160.1 hypothetical protein LOTGIDRAFT_233214 [Lottia gigantea]
MQKCGSRALGQGARMITEIFNNSKHFFELGESDKSKYSRTNGLRNHGYVCIGRERLDPSRPIDLKGAFNYTPMDPGEWPTEEVPGMKESFTNLYNSFRLLSYNVLDVLSLALGFEDRHFFRNYHKGMGGTENPSTLRALHYPPLPETDVKQGQLRCTEHVDHRVLTFLVQDQNGGLEVCNRDGKYIRLKPDPECICIIIGNILQRFTSDKLLATKHRVRIPEDDVLKQSTRQSQAFFLHPDNDVIIRCLDGNDAYEPISSIDYLAWRFNKYFKEETI